MVSVSVIIPVYNDIRLYLCLAALQRQTYQNFEVIVIDNHSTEDIQSICEPFGVRYYSETQPGSYAARNRGIAEAEGEIIALTDADCIPDSNWLMAGVQAMAITPLIGGAIQFCFQGKHPNIVEYADSLSYLRQQDYVIQEHYAASANLFVHRSVFEAVGQFDQRLINLGDKEFCQRADAAGFRAAYCPDAIVRHPARTTLRALLHKARRQARASVKLAALRGEPAPQANFLPLGWTFWRAVATDPKLPRLSQKLIFIAVIHSLKWTIAYILFISAKHQNLHPN